MNSFLGHVDTLLNYDKSVKYNFFEDNNNCHVDLPKLKKGRVKLVTFAIFVEPQFKPHYALQRTIQLLDRFHLLLSKARELVLIEDYCDVKKIINSDKIGVMLAIEGAESIFDLSVLRIFHKLGVRMISLTWNQRNHLADGVGELEANGGITKLGKKIIKEITNLRIIIDVSHLAPASFWDIIKLVDLPVVASHSNAKSLCNHPRNLDDKQIKAISKKQGLIGLNFAPFFLTKKKDVEIIHIIKHINYIKEMIGIEHIVLGSDFDGITETPATLTNAGQLGNLYTELVNNNFDKKEIKKVFYKNWLNFFKNYWIT